MWAALESEEYGYQELHRGEIRTGTVVEKTPDHLVIDIGAKTEGIVTSEDLDKLGPEAVAKIKVGDEVAVYVLRAESPSGEIILSMNMARSQQDWTRATELLESGEIIEAKVAGQNKGGLLVQFGQLQAFVPRSHIVHASGQGENLSQMVGQTVPIKVIEVDRRQRRLIASERAAWREWRKTQKERLLEELNEGDVRKGRVTTITDFGAFVDLGGADGLIHVSELSWDRNVQPKDVLRVGDEVEVYVLNVDQERNRIGLSLKRLKHDPWATIEERYAAGQLVPGTITNVAKFGAFARIDEGVEGLIHISELADRPVNNPNEVVREGEAYTLKVLGIDTQRKRVSLSLRQAPQEALADQPAALPDDGAAPVDMDQDVEEQASAVATDSPADEMAVTSDDATEAAPTAEADTAPVDSMQETATAEADVAPADSTEEAPAAQADAEETAATTTDLPSAEALEESMTEAPTPATETSEE